MQSKDNGHKTRNSVSFECIQTAGQLLRAQTANKLELAHALAHSTRISGAQLIWSLWSGDDSRQPRPLIAGAQCATGLREIKEVPARHIASNDSTRTYTIADIA